ncbi:MAG: hypothetical protein VR69_00135 [Peptococcaceae bacterium BRH_c4b]|nr:MAG: hypothetical protein VR69_00135 [Peptococcaceae bacterium BRH_c4b]
MAITYNIYCDESCHLENDHEKIMVIGSIWCPLNRVQEISKQIRQIKENHNLNKDFEIKWTKVSPAKQNFYLELLDYFFRNDDLHFRTLIVPDKTKLNHDFFGQDHDVWYYKIFFTLLKVIFNPYDSYHIYLDIKDTRGSVKLKKLHDVLCNNMYDFSRQIIERVQTVRSHEVELLQITDLLIGVISYANRGLDTSPAKVALVEKMKILSGYSLTKTTLLREHKVNIFRWNASEVG